ncbi:hypothetical protein OROHE_001887 [Orobanche hederae]
MAVLALDRLIWAVGRHGWGRKQVGDPQRPEGNYWFRDAIRTSSAAAGKVEAAATGLRAGVSTVREFKPVLKVSTMKNASRFFIRPDIQEVKNFILRRGVSGVSSSHTISNISNGARELNSEEWLNVGSLRTIKEIVNSDVVGTYTCRGIIVDFHPEESWYYQSYGNNRCYKDVPKGSKVGDYCKSAAD